MDTRDKQLAHFLVDDDVPAGLKQRIKRELTATKVRVARKGQKER